MKLLVCALASLVSLCAVDRLQACTTVATFGKEGVTVGNNLDYSDYSPRLWFVPEAPGQHARVCYGFDKNWRIAEGGMNDRGLYIAVNALSQETDWAADSTRKDWEAWEGWLKSGVPDGILAKCGTVADAVAVFKAYNLFTLRKVKFLLADRTGDSAVIEWSKGRLRVLRRADRNHQVSTNVLTSDYEAGSASCYRYGLAVKMLESAGGARALDLVRGILSATHLEFQTPTVYSGVYNLNTGEMSVYYFHNYEAVFRINAFDEMKKGRAQYLVSDLVKVKPYVAQVYGEFARGK